MKTIKTLALLFMLGMVPISTTSASAAGLGETMAEPAMMSAGARAAEIRRLRHVPSVGVINLNLRLSSRLRGDGNNLSSFRIAAQKNAAGIRKLRAALKSNAVTRRALAEHGVAISHVVGVKIGSYGALRVYMLR